jgi:hypothetical protein
MKKRKPGIIKDPKIRGEWVESVFMVRAGEQGLVVSKPWGDSRSYDFVVGRPGRFVSVQVKSTTVESGGGYACAIRKQNQGYARGSFDFVAAYVVQEDVWYILPASAIRGKESVGLCSNSTQAKYEAYREAWHLLREASEVSSEASGGGETGTEDSSAVECVESRSAGALGRLEAAMNYFKQHLESSNVDPRKR